MQVGYLESIQRYPIEHGEQLKFSVKSHVRSSFIRCPITSCSFRTSQQRPKPWTVHQPSKLDPKHSPVVPHEKHHHGTHSKNHCDRTMFCSNLRIPKKHSYFHYSSIFESENTQKPFILSPELDSSRQTFRLNMILKCQSLARCNLCNFHFLFFFWGGIQLSALLFCFPIKKKTRSIFSGLWRKSHEHHFLFAFQFRGYFWLWLPETIKVMGTLQIHNLLYQLQYPLLYQLQYPLLYQLQYPLLYQLYPLSIRLAKKGKQHWAYH